MASLAGMDDERDVMNEFEVSGCIYREERSGGGGRLYSMPPCNLRHPNSAIILVVGGEATLGAGGPHRERSYLAAEIRRRR